MTKNKKGILFICILLIIGGFTVKYLLENVFVTYDAFDEHKLTKDEKKFYKTFYSENPEFISKGKLFDLKLNYYMANAPQESQVFAVKKTSSLINDITWEIHYQKGNQDKQYVYNIDYGDSNIYIESIMLRSFFHQIFDEDLLEYPKIDIQDLRIVIKYPGGKEEHKLKFNPTKLYETYLNNPNNTNKEIYFNMLYEYDFNRWEIEISEYMKTTDYISYNLLKNVYNERDFSDKDPVFIYQLIKNEILNGKIDQHYLSIGCLEMGCYQNAPLTFHYQVGATLSLLYPYVEDESGKLDILNHFAKRPANILSLLKQGNMHFINDGNTLSKSELSHEENLLLEAIDYQANYFEILYGIDEKRYAEEFITYIDQLYLIWEFSYKELKDDKDKVIGYLDFLSFLNEMQADKLLVPYVLDKQADADTIKSMKFLRDKYCLKIDEERTYIGFFEYLDHDKVPKAQ